MPVYRIQAPDGSVLRIEGPEGATPEQLITVAAQHYGGARGPAKAEKPYNFTDDMSAGEKFAAGLGKMMVDTGRSVGQLGRAVLPAGAANALGLPTQADIDEAARLDKPLMSTGWGMAGNMAGQVGAAFIPGTGQVKAAKMADAAWKAGGVIGVLKALGLAGATGAAQTVVMNPRTSEQSLPGQAAGGAAFGAGGQLAGGLLGGGVQVARNVASGGKGTAGRAMTEAAAMPADELAALIRAGNRELVQGSKPTTAQAAMNAGISRLQAGVRTMQPVPFEASKQAQNTARLSALDALAPGARGRTSQDAAENLGRTAAEEAGAWKGMLKDQVTDQYSQAHNSGAKLLLPEQGAAESVLKKIYPRGPIPNDGNATVLHAFVNQMKADGPVSLAEFDALRKQAGAKQRDLAQTDATASKAWGDIKAMFNDSEAAAIAKADKLAPTGKGPHGPIYGGLLGDPENAVAHLLRTREGEVPGALAHADVPGPISLAYGKPPAQGVEGSGVAKLAAKHPEVLDDLQGFLSSMSKNAELSGANRIRLSDGDARRGVVSLDHLGAPTDPWLLTAFEKANPAQGGVRSTSSTTMDTAGLLGGGDTARPTGLLSMPDIEASFKAFADQVNPPAPPRDPRQYSGGLLGAMLPEQAAPLKAGRQLHGELQDRFNTGPLSYAWRTGSDGQPMAQGAELGKRLVHSGASQVADIEALKKAVLARGPTMKAAKEYALTDLLESATQRGADADVAQLLPSKFGAWTDRRSGMLRGLLDTGELGTIKNVGADLNRAARAETLGQGSGSNTAEKLMSMGLLDSPWLDRGMGLIPTKLGGTAVRGLLGAMRESGRKQAAKDVAPALVDPEVALRSLQAYGLLMQPNAAQQRSWLGGLLGAPVLSSTQD